MFEAKVYNIVIVSPSDVTAERKILVEIINEWNYINSKKHKIILFPNGWELNTYPDSGMHPQDHINSQIIDTADILIGIFWTRIGTKTKNNLSGTIEEIERHVRNNKPAQLYFSKRDIPHDLIESSQIKELNNYKREIQDKSYYKEFSDLDDFKKAVFKNLSLLINDKLLTNTENETSSLELTEDAITLLLEAVNDNTGTILRLMTMGNVIVQTNGKAYQSNTPEQLADIENAIEVLEEAKLIRSISPKRDSFKILKKGYDYSKKLMNASKKSNATPDQFQNDIIKVLNIVPSTGKEFNSKFQNIMDEIGQYRLRKINPVLNDLDLMNIRWSSDGSPMISIMQGFHSYSKDDIQNIINEVNEGKFDYVR